MRILEIDLKKVVALSTLSQLGLLGTGLGGGLFTLAFLHIIIHALIKRALFIVVGIILHKRLRTQDKRRLLWDRRYQRYSLASLALCRISLCGVRLTRGSIRKETLLLETLGSKLSPTRNLCFLFGVSLTFIYCLRLLSVCLQTEGKNRRTDT